MVTAAFMLLTVSTLAVHGKYVTIDSLQRGCEGKTFCDHKPADYPQEEIDYWLLKNHKNLTLLHRTKRDVQINTPKLMPGSANGNCEMQSRMITPYELKTPGQLPQIIVQSQFFEQQIPEVICSSPQNDCFKSFIREGSGTKAKCGIKYTNAYLLVYDKNQNDVIQASTPLPIDCVCLMV